MATLHLPVLVKEVFDFINLKSGGIYADFTFGEGGHTGEFLKRGVGQVLATDRDSSTLERYQKEGEFREDPRLRLFHTRFSNFAAVLPKEGVDGILIDLGVSTRQLLERDRGFSLMQEGPLDMRMDRSEGPTLSEFLEGMEEDELATLLKENTDLKNAHFIARKLLVRLQEGKIQNTLDLAYVMGPKRGPIHPATALFLGLRMAVNEEMKEIEETLPNVIDFLKPGGRLVVLTFHSTEDRMVKRIFNRLAGKCICEEKICRCPREARVTVLTKKPIEASPDEVAINPRARSAKLRCVEKI